MKQNPFRLHDIVIPVLAVFGMIGLTFAVVAAAPGCTDAQIQKFTAPTTQAVPSTQPGQPPTTQPGPSKQDQVVTVIDTAQGYVDAVSAVASLFPGKTAAMVTVIAGLLGIAFGVGRKTAQNPPKSPAEFIKDVADGTIDAATLAKAIPGAGATADKVVAAAKVIEAILAAHNAPAPAQNPPLEPTTDPKQL